MQHAPLRIFSSPVPAALQLAVVVPTLNERENVARLLELLALALADIEWEAVFVDDGSSDGTPEYLTEVSRRDRRVRLIRRVGRRGLSSAVMEGMLASTAPVVAVIDADLQHDERVLPALYRAIADGEADLAVGTRYADGGSTGTWSARRRAISRLATRLAVSIAGTRLSDPMSGFFAIDRDCLLRAAPRVSGVGYKLLLDIAASSPTPLRIAERPYTFRTRDAGTSKLDSAIVLQYFELLAEKSIGRCIPIRFIKFALVGLIGVAVHLGLLSLALDIASLSFRASQMIAVLGAICFNFWLNNQFTYRDRRLRGLRMASGLVSFALVCSLGALANVGIGVMLFREHSAWWLAGLAGAAVGSVWNYTMGNLLTWRRA
ncbi:glycosyltransferase [Sphingomonas abietis]|uniref:Glycosyltransferase family 2 protein n=1 Tax=Sphingomonas abietis TaxID=3012344 RepID=A0ABY7NKD7_9SPHN|nr:glycosyltransferase family 2 protein [Sphingomonas abietis]WBO20971.1 glycosyltransferase family 2 protein [Sphingomonas abietis]